MRWIWAIDTIAWAIKLTIKTNCLLVLAKKSRKANMRNKLENDGLHFQFIVCCLLMIRGTPTERTTTTMAFFEWATNPIQWKRVCCQKIESFR